MGHSNAKISNTKALGNLVREERKRQGLTQTELAGLSNVGVTFLSHLENGKETAEVGKVIDVLTLLGIDLYGCRRA